MHDNLYEIHFYFRLGEWQLGIYHPLATLPASSTVSFQLPIDCNEVQSAPTLLKDNTLKQTRDRLRFYSVNFSFVNVSE